MKNVKRTQGFTLIELLIVIAIIGILAAVLIPNLLGAQKRAYDTGAQACAKSVQTALATQQIDKQTYVGPTDKASLIALDGTSAGCSRAEIVVSGLATSVSTYSFTINDTRGKNTYTVTPSNISAN
jgi:type IV pilus assembly protein PilA